MILGSVAVVLGWHATRGRAWPRAALIAAADDPDERNPE